VIVGRRKEKNGKSTSSKRSREELRRIFRNRKNYSTRRESKWNLNAIIIGIIVAIIMGGIQVPLRLAEVVVVEVALQM
jgi:hypothetical protein